MIGADGHTVVLIEVLVNQGRKIHAIINLQLGTSGLFKEFAHIDGDYCISP